MNYFDSHCHLHFPDFDPDRQEVLFNCHNKGISALCIPATKASEWLSLLNYSVACKSSPVRQFLSLGLHPCFLNDHSLKQLETLDSLLSTHRNKIVAIGETGLDFFNRSLSDYQRQFQQQLFTGQVRMACSHQLPMIIHARKSHDQILKILRRFQPERGGIIHGFSGSEQQAYQYIDLNFKLGFGGVITYSRATKTRQLASTLPLEQIVLETDAPDMPLSGFQGQRNSPEQIPVIANLLAKLRNEPVVQVAGVTFENCLKVFNLNG